MPKPSGSRLLSPGQSLFGGLPGPLIRRLWENLPPPPRSLEQICRNPKDRPGGPLFTNRAAGGASSHKTSNDGWPEAAGPKARLMTPPQNWLAKSGLGCNYFFSSAFSVYSSWGKSVMSARRVKWMSATSQISR